MTQEVRRAWRRRGAMECLAKPVEPRILSAVRFAWMPPSGFVDSRVRHTRLAARQGTEVAVQK